MDNLKHKSGHHEHSHETYCNCGQEHHHEYGHTHEGHCNCGHEHGHTHEGHCDCGHEHHHEDHHKHVHEITSTAPQKVYRLEHLGCANCAAKMERKINELPQVKEASITFATKKLVVATECQEELQPILQKICESIESEVVVVAEEERKEPKVEKAGFFQTYKKQVCTIGAGAIFFIAGILSKYMITEIEIPICELLFVIAYIILGASIIWRALKNLLNGRVFDENFLMSVATIAAFAIGDFAEAVGVMLFYRVGEFFEDVAVERSRSQIMEAVDLRPEVVNLIEGTQVKVISAKEAVPKDLILVRPGDRIPLDGVVEEGESRIDTSPVTGEPVPVRVYPGEEVISGCVNEQGVLKVRVKKALSESMVSRILDSVENAAASKPKIDRFITRFARVYTPVVVAAAVLTALIPSLITGEWEHWIYTAITFLVISCPCALVLSVPLAFFSGIGAGSRKGILFKGGVAIEALKDVKAVVMDKTGTITQGKFEVQKTVTVNRLTEKQILTIAADCELDSTHPIAASIVRAANERGLKLVRPQNVQEIPGKGMKASFPEGTVLCGNIALLEEHNVKLTNFQLENSGTEVLIAVEGRLEGYLVIDDIVKEDAKESIKEMKKQGLMTAILTGDAKKSAQAVAKMVGIDKVYAQLIPQEKLEKLKELRNEYGAVMFVGDGINDAPVLAGADVGAAMGSGADAAIEAADVVFMTSSVGAIPEAIEIAKITGRIAVQNVVFALFIKLLVMILGLIGFANMWLAVFADTGVAMLCILNSIRVLYKK